MELNRTREEITRDVEQTRSEAKRAFRNAGEVWSGRNAVASAWRSTKRSYHRAHDKVADAAWATDNAIHEKIYASAGIALGVGAVLGFLLTSRPRHRKQRKS